MAKYTTPTMDCETNRGEDFYRGLNEDMVRHFLFKKAPYVFGYIDFWWKWLPNMEDLPRIDYHYRFYDTVKVTLYTGEVAVYPNRWAFTAPRHTLIEHAVNEMLREVEHGRHQKTD